MKTREQLTAELTESFKDTPEQPGFPKSAFVEAAVQLIEEGRATWDGEALILVEGGKQ